MQYDFDGNGAVTADEIRRVTEYNLRRSPTDREKRINDVVQSVMVLDTDKDGKVSFAEAVKYASPQLQRSLGSPETAERTRRALTLDAASKGELIWQDFETAGEALFRKADADHDGKISQQELDDYRRTLTGGQPPSRDNKIPAIPR
jgi:Ca2+-binding EF-hand superfamily protein